VKSRFRQLTLTRPACVCVLMLAALSAGAESASANAGRLFYTATQRAQLEAARARNVTEVIRPTQRGPAATPPAVRFDGLVIRSDGKRTTWINGQRHTGAADAAGLKPGQTRSVGKVYEPYQLLRGDEAGAAAAGKPTP